MNISEYQCADQFSRLLVNLCENIRECRRIFGIRLFSLENSRMCGSSFTLMIVKRRYSVASFAAACLEDVGVNSPLLKFFGNKLGFSTHLRLQTIFLLKIWNIIQNNNYCSLKTKKKQFCP